MRAAGRVSARFQYDFHLPAACPWARSAGKCAHFLHAYGQKHCGYEEAPHVSRHRDVVGKHRMDKQRATVAATVSTRLSTSHLPIVADGAARSLRLTYHYSQGLGAAGMKTSRALQQRCCGRTRRPTLK